MGLSSKMDESSKEDDEALKPKFRIHSDPLHIMPRVQELAKEAEQLAAHEAEHKAQAQARSRQLAERKRQLAAKQSKVNELGSGICRQPGTARAVSVGRLAVVKINTSQN